MITINFKFELLGKKSGYEHDFISFLLFQKKKKEKKNPNFSPFFLPF